MALQTSLLATLIAVNIAGLAGAGDRNGSQPSSATTLDKVITRCDSPEGFGDAQHNRMSAALGDKTAEMDRAVRFPERGTLALTRGQQGYDIIHTINDDTNWRATESEADLIDSGAGEAPYHLVLNRSSGPEHFLFSIGSDGRGELLWSTGDRTAVTDCRPG